MTRQVFELIATATAEVIRGCCGNPDTACTCTADNHSEESA